MALRQTEGLIVSVLALMNLAISAPDHTTLSRRAVGLTLLKSGSAPRGPLYILMAQVYKSLAQDTSYGQRTLVETTRVRYPSLIAPRLWARAFEVPQSEAAIGAAVWNRMLTAGLSNFVRRQQVNA